MLVENDSHYYMALWLYKDMLIWFYAHEGAGEGISSLIILMHPLRYKKVANEQLCRADDTKKRTFRVH